MEINILERIYTMLITPVQNINFTAYKPKDVNKLKDYTLQKKQGSLYDLYKKFDVALVDTFKLTERIEVPKHTQNWKLGVRAEAPFIKGNAYKQLRGARYSKVGY